MLAGAALSALALLAVLHHARMVVRHSQHPLTPHTNMHMHQHRMLIGQPQQPPNNETLGAGPAAAEEEFAALPVHLLDRVYATVQGGILHKSINLSLYMCVCVVVVCRFSCMLSSSRSMGSWPSRLPRKTGGTSSWH